LLILEEKLTSKENCNGHVVLYRNMLVQYTEAFSIA